MSSVRVCVCCLSILHVRETEALTVREENFIRSIFPIRFTLKCKEIITQRIRYQIKIIHQDPGLQTCCVCSFLWVMRLLLFQFVQILLWRILCRERHCDLQIIRLAEFTFKAKHRVYVFILPAEAEKPNSFKQCFPLC